MEPKRARKPNFLIDHPLLLMDQNPIPLLTNKEGSPSFLNRRGKRIGFGVLLEFNI